jgi:predicted O-methyltransferase YrrM
MTATKRKSAWRNILRAAANPAKKAVILRKIARRFLDKKGSLTDRQYADWLKANAADENAFLAGFDAKLVAEAERFSTGLHARAQKILSAIPYALGGGAVIRVLYLLTRCKQPETVVETGVASGYSSACFLEALQKNHKGHLYSSDFPYVRIENAEQYVGIVVDRNLKDRWTLMLNGDEANIPEIVRQVDRIDLFHYDSDKSYIGRERTMERVLPKMAKDGLIIMDDIQDNCFFHDFARAHPDMRCEVVHRKGKYIGILNRTD